MNSVMRSMAAAIAVTLMSSSVFAEQRTVRIYNWLEYLPGEILKDFEEETGIRPVYDVFDSIEMLESKLLTGNSGYDATGGPGHSQQPQPVPHRRGDDQALHPAALAA